jgi:hypothetical protein
VRSPAGRMGRACDPLTANFEIAGPETQDFEDLAPRTLTVRGQNIKLVPTWHGVSTPCTPGEVLLPGPALESPRRSSRTGSASPHSRALPSQSIAPRTVLQPRVLQSAERFTGAVLIGLGLRLATNPAEPIPYGTAKLAVRSRLTRSRDARHRSPLSDGSRGAHRPTRQVPAARTDERLVQPLVSTTTGMMRSVLAS